MNAAVRIKRWWTLSAAPLWRFATLATSTNDVAYFLTFMKVQPGANRRTTVPEKQLDALKKIRKIEKVAITMLCNLKAARRRASRFGLFWPNMYCACAEAATSEFPVEIPTLSLDSATLISRISKSKRVKGDQGRKSRPNFALLILYKISRRVGEMFEWMLQVRPRNKPLIYFWRGVYRSSERLESECQKQR